MSFGFGFVGSLVVVVVVAGVVVGASDETGVGGIVVPVVVAFSFLTLI